MSHSQICEFIERWSLRNRPDVCEWNYEETIVEDEGVEIVVCGRFDHHNEGVEFEQESLSRASLSVLYRESDSTFVAFYRSDDRLSNYERESSSRMSN